MEHISTKSVGEHRPKVARKYALPTAGSYNLIQHDLITGGAHGPKVPLGWLHGGAIAGKRRRGSGRKLEESWHETCNDRR